MFAQDQAEANGGGLRVFEEVVRNTKGRKSKATKRGARFEGSQNFESILHATARHHPHHVPLMRARRHPHPHPGYEEE